MEREALTLEALSIAMAAHNSGGLVIVQVERIAERGSLNPRQVKIPGILVDCVVVAERPEDHMQTFAETLIAPAFASEIRVPMRRFRPLAMGERKIIARRAALELKANACRQSRHRHAGGHRGGGDRGASHRSADADRRAGRHRRRSGFRPELRCRNQCARRSSISPTSSTSTTAAGSTARSSASAQADRHGNLNVSRFGPRLAGAGGFINISQNAKKVVFVGTFTAGARRRVATAA